MTRGQERGPGLQGMTVSVSELEEIAADGWRAPEEARLGRCIAPSLPETAADIRKLLISAPWRAFGEEAVPAGPRVWAALIRRCP